MLHKCKYKYIWCLVANFNFAIMIANATTQCEWTIRPEKLWENGSFRFHPTDNLALWIIQTVISNFDENELSVVDCIMNMTPFGGKFNFYFFPDLHALKLLKVKCNPTNNMEAKWLMAQLKAFLVFMFFALTL